MCKNGQQPTSVRFDQETLDGLAFVVRESATPRDRTAAIRGIVRKYNLLLQSQLDAEEDGTALAIVRVSGSVGGVVKIAGQPAVVDLKL